MSSLTRKGWMLIFSFVLLSVSEMPAWFQCAGMASSPRKASDCAAHYVPSSKIASLDPSHPYSLAELVDIAERNNPRTRVLWGVPNRRRSMSLQEPILSMCSRLPWAEPICKRAAQSKVVKMMVANLGEMNGENILKMDARTYCTHIESRFRCHFRSIHPVSLLECMAGTMGLERATLCRDGAQETGNL